MSYKTRPILGTLLLRILFTDSLFGFDESLANNEL